MFGGLLKSTSLAALVAVAGVTLSGLTAQAADLGGNCCADLEERIAELEATTARKGNRKVSLTVSGWVNESVLFWNDNSETNAYQTTNMVAQSRVRFLGEAKIDAKWKAGYLMELGINGARSDDVSNNADDSSSAVSTQNAVSVRHSVFWIQNADLGKVWLGQTSQSTDGITEISLANTGHFATQNLAAQFGAFFVRNSATGAISTNRVNRFTGGAASGSSAGTDSGQIGEGNRRNLVKYDTPTLAGFVGSASWGEDDFWDVSLRYAGEFSGFKLAAGIGYEQTSDGNVLTGTGERNCINRVALNVAGGSDVKCNQLGISGSIMHVGTGLFVNGVYGRREDENAVSGGASKNSTQWMVQAGIEQKFSPLGKTTIFGEYQEFDIGQNAVSQNTKATATNWGIGFNQNIEAAALDIYLKYNNVSDLSTRTTTGVVTNFEDFQTVVVGGRLQF
jgi:hypothetical protein